MDLIKGIKPEFLELAKALSTKKPKLKLVKK